MLHRHRMYIPPNEGPSLCSTVDLHAGNVPLDSLFFLLIFLFLHRGGQRRTRVRRVSHRSQQRHRCTCAHAAVRGSERIQGRRRRRHTTRDRRRAVFWPSVGRVVEKAALGTCILRPSPNVLLDEAVVRETSCTNQGVFARWSLLIGTEHCVSQSVVPLSSRGNERLLHRAQRIPRHRIRHWLHGLGGLRRHGLKVRWRAGSETRLR